METHCLTNGRIPPVLLPSWSAYQSLGGNIKSNPAVIAESRR